jgi:hypothetical protein
MRGWRKSHDEEFIKHAKAFKSWAIGAGSTHTRRVWHMQNFENFNGRASF